MGPRPCPIFRIFHAYLQSGRRPDCPFIRVAIRATLISKQVHIFHKTEMPVWVTYDSGADGNYLNKTDRTHAGLPILKPLKKRVGVADGGVSVGTHVTHLTFPQLPHKESTADTVTYLPNSPMSVGTASDDNIVSVFAKDGVKFYYREDVLEQN